MKEEQIAKKHVTQKEKEHIQKAKFTKLSLLLSSLF